MSYREKLKRIFLNNGREHGITLDQSLLMIDKLNDVLNGLDHFKEGAQINGHQILSIMFNETSILITNAKGLISYVNDKCCETLGYSSEELLGQHTRIFKTGIHSADFYQELWKTLYKGQTWKGEMTAKRKDGTFCWNFMSIFPLYNDSNQLYGFLTLRTDLTEQKNLKKHARLQEMISELQSNELFGCVDENNIIFCINPALKNIFGYDPDEVVGVSAFDFVKAEELPHYKLWFEKLKEKPGNIDTVELTIADKCGAWIPSEITAKNLLHDAEINGIVFINRNIAEQKDLFSRIEKIEYYEFITGLRNTKSFVETLSKEIHLAKENNAVLAVIKIGIDDFNYVNSTFGHKVGDQLLIDFSKRIQREINNENVELFKAEGDKFFIIMRNINDLDNIQPTLEELSDNITKESYKVLGHEIYLSASMGVSMFPFSGDEMEKLLKNVATAFYHVKKKGKNQIQIFSPTMDFDSYKQFALRNDCKKALLMDEFCLYYQPRYHSKTNEMVSAEALIRWKHPKFGIVSPFEFIQMAEESGLIIQIGEWVINKVCKQIKIWEYENLPMRKISINLSTLQLLQSDFVEIVSTILRNSRVDSKWIEFEITESVIIQNEERVFANINKLRAMGITIALDDFGTGYSSLHYLKKIPCEVIKLDKSLIDEVHKDKDNYEIIASTIKLCHKLGKTVVGEGVETSEQLSLLKFLKCDEIQGYYFSKPVNTHKFKELLKDIKWKKNDTNINLLKMDRRKSFRIELKAPLLADITIVCIGNSKLRLGSSPTHIKNIGPEGLCFYSTLHLPVKEDIILQFKTQFFNKELIFNGYIVWNAEVDNHYFRYGVKFLKNELQSVLLIKEKAK